LCVLTKYHSLVNTKV